MRLAYLYSRYPFLSQTFCDSEMLALEARGWDLVVGSINPPVGSLRHEHISNLRAPILYAPPPRVLDLLEERARLSGRWPEDMVKRHDKVYGSSFKAAERARNALYFAEQFQRLGVGHVHVHFANRATHTALFLHELTGLPFSFTTHGQDFMVDLGSDALLAEMAATATFSVAVCDFSKELLAQRCPASASKIHRIYNGLNPSSFPEATRAPHGGPFRLLSIGRLIEFKGFHHLIKAVWEARQRDVAMTLRIVGEGPWRERLQQQVDTLAVGDAVTLVGSQNLEGIQRELQEADAFALACTVDGKGASDLLPTVITEAMLSGLPVVSTTVAGVPEMVASGETGFLVEPDEPRRLADALCELAADPARARAMGAAARIRATLLFGTDTTIPQFEGLLARELPSRAQATSLPATSPSILGFYDLSLPDRREWLRNEFPVLQEKGASLLIAGGGVNTRMLQTLDDAELSAAQWLPDGMVLEMEWLARETWRWKLEDLRTELSTMVDGEAFLRAARRAVWLAVCAAKISQRPTLLYAAGAEESLSVWLAGLLTGSPAALVFEAGCRWPSELVARMTRDATRLSDAQSKQSSEKNLFRLVSKRTFPKWRRVLHPDACRKEADGIRQQAFSAWLEGESTP